MKKITLTIAILTITLVLFNMELVSYLLMQSSGQLSVLWNARPIKEVLLDPAIDGEIKDNIALIMEIQQFAQDSLGMESEGKYASIYDQKGQDILWNLSACDPFIFESKEWYFPIIGSVSYKGFFNYKKAEAEKQALDELGYDTRIRPVNAWSTLGWFDDPILSNTLQRSPGSLAELFIHEIAHAHIFYKDSLIFNENIASFIGEQGARKFLENRYGRHSKEYTNYLNSESDYEMFTNHVLTGKNLLEKLYDSFDSLEVMDVKTASKRQLISVFVDAMDTLSFSDPDRFGEAFQDELLNNAFFMAFDRYSSLKGYMKKQLDQQFSGNLSAYIEHHKSQ